MMFLRAKFAGKILCLSRSFSNPIDSALLSSKSTVSLVNLYRKNSLSKNQLSLLIQKLVETVPKLPENNNLFLSDNGKSFINDLLKKGSGFSVQDKLNLLKVINMDSFKNRFVIVSIASLNLLAEEISLEIDPLINPKEFVIFYKIYARQFKPSQILNDKMYNLLQQKNLDFELYFDIVEASIIMPFELFSLTVCNYAITKINENISKLDIKNIVKYWRICIEMNFRYSINQNLSNSLSDLIKENMDILTGDDLCSIIRVYVKHPYLEINMLINSIERFKNIMQHGYKSNSKYLSEIAMKLGQYKIVNPGFIIDLNTLFYFEKELCVSNKISSIENLKYITLASYLKRYSKEIPKEVSSFLTGKLINNASENLKLVIMIYLSDNPEKTLDSYTNLISAVSQDLSTHTLVNIYLFVCNLQLQNKSSNFKNFMNFIENEICNKIYDYATYKVIKEVCRKYKIELKLTELWKKINNRVIDVFTKLLKVNQIHYRQVIESAILLYSDIGDLKDNWLKIFKLVDQSTQEINISISKYFEELNIEGIFEVLGNYEYTNRHCLATCLNMKISKPSYLIIRDATKLFNQLKVAALLDPKLIINENTLFYSIFTKGLGYKVKDSINSADLEVLHSELSSSNFQKFMKLVMQYDLLDTQKIESFRESNRNSAMSGFQNLFGFLNVLPNLDKEYTADIKSYFEIEDNCTIGNFIEKVNTYMRLKDSVYQDSDFTQAVQGFILKVKDKKDILVEILEGIAYPSCDKDEFSSSLIQLIVQNVIREPKEEELRYVAITLICLVRRSYPDENTLENIERMLKSKINDCDTLAHLLDIYTDKNRNNSFFEDCLINGIKYLSESTYLELFRNIRN